MEKTITLDNIKNLSIEQITELYRQGYSIAGTYNTGCSSCEQYPIPERPTGFRYIQGLAGDCGTITQGTTKNLNVSVTTAGTLPYTFKVYRASGTNATSGFTQIETTYSGGASETSHSFPHIFNEATGSYTYRGEVTDSCPTSSGGPKIVASDCNVTISSVVTCNTPVLTMNTLPATITQNNTSSITLTQTTVGTANYKYEIYVDIVKIADSGATPISNTTWTYSSYQWTTLGSHTIYGKVIDSCLPANGGPKSATTATQTVNVVASCTNPTVTMTIT